MALFKNKKKELSYEETIKEQKIIEEEIVEDEVVDANGVVKKVKKKRETTFEKNNQNVLLKGSRKIKDFIAPDGFDKSREDCIVVDGKYVKNFLVKGYPSTVQVGWLNEIFNNADSDIDTAIYIRPADDKQALDEITAKITQKEAQLEIEARKGNIRNISRYRDDIANLMDSKRKLEQNFENLFHIQIACNLYSDTYEELTKKSQKLMNKLRGRKIELSSMFLRQEEGYRTALPFGKAFADDYFRNFSSGALTACFPFYNSDISHKNGIFVGVNLATRTPVLIDFYDRSVLNNSNVSIFGTAGSGKTFFVSLLTLRSALKGIRTVIIDPEGEYKNLTVKMGGAYIKLAPNSNQTINPFDLEEEIDKVNGEEIKKVDIKNKIADILNLIAIMSGGMDKEQQSITSYILSELYKNFGFTENPESLYTEEATYDPTTGSLVHDKKKQMPRLSDFHKLLTAYGEQEGLEKIKSLSNALKMFIDGGVYDLFDKYTADDLKTFATAPLVTFDISQLEEGILRPIGMFIALSWAWEKFAKKNPHIKKRIIVDEAWMLMSKNMPGHEFSSQFLENCSRRIRKRNGGLLVASQNFIEFADSPQGKAVLTNTTVNIFLKQNSTDIDLVQETFRLSDGEKQFLLVASRGEMLIRMNEESSIALAVPFAIETDLITRRD